VYFCYLLLLLCAYKQINKIKPIDDDATTVECVNEADVVFVLDSSGSIDHPYFDNMRSFVSRVVASFDVEDGRVRVGVVAFADDVQPAFNLNRYNSRQDIQVPAPNCCCLLLCIGTRVFSSKSRPRFNVLSIDYVRVTDCFYDYE